MHLTVHAFKTHAIDVVVGRKLNWQFDDHMGAGMFDCTACDLTLEDKRKAAEFLRSPESSDPDIQSGYCEIKN